MPWSFDCRCNAGYGGDGLKCTDVNECAESLCHPMATCNNTLGSCTCTCNGTECEVEVDSSLPCQESKGAICHSLASCAETQQPGPIPVGSNIVAAGVPWPAGSDGAFRCECESGVLCHGYGSQGCSTRDQIHANCLRCTKPCCS
mmetsp:Transcript_3764/g.5562  ORF Transcript_3764/g.5562 Transcript_3764/m.5562 type:complete len:145 (+) Transcript_3764:1171-1605(+)